MPPEKTERLGFLNRALVQAAIVLGGAFLISAIIFAYTFYAVRSLDDTLTATGSAKQKVTADSAKWTSSISRSAFDGSIPAVYAQVERDTIAAKVYFKQAGIADDQIQVTPIFVNQEYSSNDGAQKRYSVMQSITVSSSDVQKVRGLAGGAGALIQKGVMFNPGMPEYYVSNLPSLRVSLLGEAVKDARARADELAKAGGVSVGKLKSSSSGVVQVLSPNSIEVSDYGSYDTQTIEKEVMVTVRATFSVR